MNSRNWGRPSLFAALVTFATVAASPSFPAAAHGTAHDTAYELALDCQLGSVMDYSKSCVFDTNGDGVYDWWVSDADGDSVYDTSSLDTDFDGRAETFYTIIGSLYGDVLVRYDHDGDWIYDDEEIGFYYTDPYRWDTDGDGYGDYIEITESSFPLNPYCTPIGCG